MANYAGISYGNELITGTDILNYIDGDGNLTGKTCSQVHNNSTGNITVGVNGTSIGITTGEVYDVIVKNVTTGGDLANALFVCSCHNCADPDEGLPKAQHPAYYTSETNIVSSGTINPASPFTLIGMGYQQS